FTTPRPPISTLFPYTTLFRSLLVLFERAPLCRSPSRSTQFPHAALSCCRRCRRMGLRFLRFCRSLSAKGCLLSPALFLRARECRSEEHTSELQSQSNLVCRLL